MMDDAEDVQATIDRLQREWVLANGEDNFNPSSKLEPFKPSYCYGCARTGGVAVYRKPQPEKKRKREASSSSKGPASQKRGQKQVKARPPPLLKTTSNLTVSARIKKKALTTLLGQKTGRANHLSSEANSKRRPFPKKGSRDDCICDECGKVLSSKSNLKRHRQIHSQVVVDDAAYSCEECGETFLAEKPYLQHLAGHKLAGGSTDRPYACDECDKTFRCFVYLSNHRKIHNTDRPFGCQYCPRMFKEQRYLINHEKTHTDILPFPCDICGIAFTRNSYLQLHQKVHTKHV